MLFRLSANFVFVLPVGVKIYFYIYEGGIQMKTIGKGNVKGNPRIKHCANDYPVF